MINLGAGVYAFNSGRSLAVFNTKKMPKDKTLISVKVKDETNTSNVKNYKVVPWGEGNVGPSSFIEKYKNNAATVGGLRVLKSTMFGCGLTLYKNYEENGEWIKKQVSERAYPEIKSFFLENKYQRFNIDLISDLETHYIAFPEFVVSDGKIVRVKRHRASWCRVSKQNEDNFEIEKVFICSDWSMVKEDNVAMVDCIDWTWTIDEIKEKVAKNKIRNFIMPIGYTMDDESYYPNVDWHSVYRNGWVDVVASIPELKKYIFENQLHFKYIIYVAEDYFENRYKGDWDEFTPEQREEKRKEMSNDINSHLTGNKAGGRSLKSPVYKDKNDQWVKGIEVIPIDDRLKDGNFLPDASAGNSEILFAMGVDPTLIGMGIPGGKNLSGSGSDKREAYSLLTANMPIKRATPIDIFEFIKNWNEWPDEVSADFPNINLTTLDKNPNGQTKVQL
jgi:hypothetical protein